MRTDVEDKLDDVINKILPNNITLADVYRLIKSVLVVVKRIERLYLLEEASCPISLPLKNKEDLLNFESMIQSESDYVKMVRIHT